MIIMHYSLESLHHSDRPHNNRRLHQFIACLFIHLKTMNAKNPKKSPIHENADVNTTCDFGDGDVTSAVLGVGCHTHGHIVSSG